MDAICVREEFSYRRIDSASANTNAVFLLGREFALKIFSPFWEEYEFERTLLKTLMDHGEIPVPDLVGHGRIAGDDGGSRPQLMTRFCKEPFAQKAQGTSPLRRCPLLMCAAPSFVKRRARSRGSRCRRGWPPAVPLLHMVVG